MNPKPPTEEEIGELLSQIQPHPGPGFHQKMADQPWNRAGRAFPRVRFSPWKVASTLGVVLLLVLGIGLFSPSVETLAQRLSQFFAPSASEQIRVEIDPREIGHPLERFNLSIEEAAALAGFTPRQPTALPPDFAFTGAFYDELRQAVILNYTTPDIKLVMRITQRYLGPDYQSVGPTAVIENVKIGPFDGEYVAGGWMIPVPEVKSGAETDTSIPTAELVWDADVNLQTLRWTDGEFLYEIIFAGGEEQPAYLHKADLIALAASMQ